MEKMLFIGGDKRMIYAARRLSRRFMCSAFGTGDTGFPEIGSLSLPLRESCFDYAVLPLPVSRDGVNICCPLGGSADFTILGKCMKCGGTVFTSKRFPMLSEVCRENRLTLIDYYEREELAVLNAVPTAEGAVAAAVNELPVMINGLKVLVTGYGRIGRITARYFAALGARVNVSARKPSDLAWIRADGHDAVDFRDTAAFAGAVSEAELIINTVPSPIIDADREGAFREGAALIELASSPCVSLTAAEKNGLRIIMAGGLPGKLSPVTAGEIIAETIENILAERGDHRNELS